MAVSTLDEMRQAAQAERPTKEFTFSNGVTVKVRGVTSFTAMTRIENAVDDMTLTLNANPPKRGGKPVELSRTTVHMMLVVKESIVEPEGVTLNDIAYLQDTDGRGFAELAGLVTTLSANGIDERADEAEANLGANP
jgi:hypothetical protein